MVACVVEVVDPDAGDELFGARGDAVAVGMGALAGDGFGDVERVFRDYACEGVVGARGEAGDDPAAVEKLAHDDGLAAVGMGA